MASGRVGKGAGLDLEHKLLEVFVGKWKYGSLFFDSQGNGSTQDLTVRDGVWTWQGERTRCTAVFTDDGRTQTAHHERSDAVVHWVPSMEVTMTKAE